jgi:hypothetical protein
MLKYIISTAYAAREDRVKFPLDGRGVRAPGAAYKELARYVAEYRNYYWQKSRTERNENPNIRKPPKENRHPYPSSKRESSDEAEGDKGGNFGRIARAGILDDYINSCDVKAHD